MTSCRTVPFYSLDHYLQMFSFIHKDLNYNALFQIVMTVHESIIMTTTCVSFRCMLTENFFFIADAVRYLIT